MRISESTLEELFKNESFQSFGPHFLDEPRTMVKVEELSGVSRQTIDSIKEKYLKIGGRSYRYIEWDYSKKGKPFQLKLEILCDYLSKRLNLDNDEKESLLDVITDKGIKNIIIKNNQRMNIAISKIVLTMLMIDILSYYIDTKTKKALKSGDILGLFQKYDLFDFFVGRNPSLYIDNKKKGRGRSGGANKIEDKTREIRVQELSSENIKVVSNVFEVSDEEVKAFGLSLIKFAEEWEFERGKGDFEKVKNESDAKDYFNEHKRDYVMSNLIQKFKESNFPIMVYPMGWHNLISFVIEPLIWYPKHLRRSYGAQLTYKLKHGTAEEKRDIKSIRKLFEHKR